MLRLLLVLILIPAAWAAISQCNPNPPGTTVNYNLGGSGSDALASGGGAAAGCAQIDNQFTNFSYFGTNPAAGSAVTTQFSGSSEAVQDIDFTSAQFSFSSSGIGSADIRFEVMLDPADVPPAPDSFWSITGLNLAIAGGTLGNANEQLNIDVDFCVNQTTCVDSSHGPGDGRLAYFLRSPAPISQACFQAPGDSSCSGTVGSSSSFGVSLDGVNAQSIAFDVLIEYVGETGALESVSGVDLTFDQTAQTPEPSGHTLLGLGIGGLILLRKRRRARMLSCLK